MTPTEATQSLLPVTQADRDAAASVAEHWHNHGREHPHVHYQNVADGVDDAWILVQAFARHRQSHSLPGDVGMREAAQAVLDSACRPGSRMLLGDETTDDSWIEYREVGQVELDALSAALTPSPCPGDGETALPRLDDGLIEAALIAHYGKGTTGINGLDLTANDVNWTFRDGFKRMWAGVRKELRRRAALTPSALSGDAGEGE